MLELIVIIPLLGRLNPANVGIIGVHIRINFTNVGVGMVTEEVLVTPVRGRPVRCTQSM